MSKHTFINYVVKSCQDDVSTSELAHLIKQADWSRMPDHVLADENIIDYVDWSKIRPMQALRLCARYRELSDRIPLDSYKFEVKDVLPSLNINPHLINRVDIDITSATREEILKLALLGKDQVLECMNFDDYYLRPADKLKIVKAYGFSELSMNKTGLLTSDLKDKFTIREILVCTGDQFIDELNVEPLSNRDWITIIDARPELVDHLKIESILKGDLYYLVALAVKFPKFLAYLTDDRLKKISSLGWEKLILEYPDKFLHKCDPSKIEASAWARIQLKYPNLVPS
jgi:hypothetical protein